MPSSALASPTPVDTGSRLSVLGPLFAVLSLLFLWFICCRHLSAEWAYNEQYNYGWFVPVFALYLFWLRWEDAPTPRLRRHEPARPGDRAGSSEQGAASAQRSIQPSIRNPPSAIRNWSALAIAIVALLLLLPIRLVEIANPDWRSISWLHTIAAVTLTLLMIWWIGGMPWLRHFAFPVAFVLVSVPWLSVIEQPIILGLMPTLASIATEALSLFGIPAEVQGNLIQINGGVVGVSEACSGVRSLQTSIMIGLLFGELKRLTVVRRLLLIAAAIGIAFVANCGRAFFLVWIAATRGLPEVERWHDIAGYAIVALVFFGCLGVMRVLAGRTSSEDGGQRSDGRNHVSASQHVSVSDGLSTSNSQRPTPNVEIENGRTAFSISAFQSFSFLRRLSTLNSQLSTFLLAGAFLWLLLVEAGSEWWYRSHETNLAKNAQWSVRWPESAPQFRNLAIEDRTRGLLHYDEGRGATWRQAANPNSDSTASWAEPVSLLYFFRWEPGHNSALLANAHRPDVCLPATGWKQVGDFGVREYQIRQNFSMPFRHFVFVHENGGRKRFADAFYCVWEDRVLPITDGGRRLSAATASANTSVAIPSRPSIDSTGMSSAPSAWSRNERIEAVFQGRRHLGQQVMEYLMIEPREIDAKDAEQQFADKVRQLVAPAGASAGS